MATIKAYTDLEQSKKLAKILPLESADMVLLHEEPYETTDSKFDGLHQALCIPFSKYDKSWRQKYKNISYFPCWSLAALLNILPVDWWDYNRHYFLEISKMGDISKPNEVRYYRFREQSDGADFGRITHISFQSDNFVDACYEMILKLHKLNFLL